MAKVKEVVVCPLKEAVRQARLSLEILHMVVFGKEAAK